MPRINIRVSIEEKDFLEKVANFNGDSISEFIRSNSLQSAKPLVDFEIYKELMKEHKKNNQSISHEGRVKD
ncbi:type II toxin-antitoxin system RelB family antitoxin [Enterococcus lactis]|uniref:type II toxin-antitoxin system RelB family antitoxin n=1 Tax=Enterococcus lactis TaxID=357441 RepID=UPI0034E96E8A